MGVVPAPLHGVHQAARGPEFGYSAIVECSSPDGSSSGSQPLPERVVERHVGVAPLSHKDRELLEVLQPLRAVVLRADERQQQEAEAVEQ